MCVRTSHGRGLDHTTLWLPVTLSLAMLFLTGCSGGGPSLVKAKGKIQVDGKPANGAILLFHPESSSNTVVSSAIADENGFYSPLTDVDEGIAEGSYRVTVVWPDPKNNANAGGIQFGVTESKDPADLLKGKYASKGSSKLTVSISRSQVELTPLELSTK